MSSSQKEKKGAEEREQQHGQISNKKRKEIFPYGNYKSYYGYWIGQEMEEDAKLKVFKKEWFEGRDCLDIGCNSGIMTIQIEVTRYCLSIDHRRVVLPEQVPLMRQLVDVIPLVTPGGIFVLEPQPWTSYEKNYRVSETTKENYRNLMFYPKDFQDLLLDKIGFRKVEDIASSVSGSKTGFNRPILVFHK
ncbi:hypothetical protein ACFX14_026222 [Malus domestica]